MKKVFENEELIISVGNNAFVEFKGVGADEISENYRADAEIAVQEWIDGEEKGDEMEAGESYVYSEDDGVGICVEIRRF